MIVRISTHGHPERRFQPFVFSEYIELCDLGKFPDVNIQLWSIMRPFGWFLSRWKPKTRAGSGGVTGMVAFFELVHHIQPSDPTTAKHVKHISVNQQSFRYFFRLDKWVFIWLLISTVYGLKEDKGDDKDDDKDDDGHRQHHNNNNKWYESETLWSPCRWYPRCFVIILLSPFCSIVVAQHLSRPVFWPVFCWPSFILARHRPMRLKWYEVFRSFQFFS